MGMLQRGSRRSETEALQTVASKYRQTMDKKQKKTFSRREAERLLARGRPALLESRRNERIDVVSRQGKLSLSYAQERLWFLSQLEGVSEAYHLPIALRLRGVDEEALRDAVKSLVARHEALRT